MRRPARATAMNERPKSMVSMTSDASSTNPGAAQGRVPASSRAVLVAVRFCVACFVCVLLAAPSLAAELSRQEVEARLSAAAGASPNFSSMDLAGLDLSGLDFKAGNLRGVNLQDSNLSGANLHGVELHGANLSGADLTGAVLDVAILRGADLSGAKLHRASAHSAPRAGRCARAW